MKKIIVTGHKGFIGVHLVRLLKEQGYYVIGIDTNYFGEDCNFIDYVKPDQEIIKDIRDIDEKDLEGAHAVCHLAGLSNDPMGELNEELTYDINYRASKQLAILSKKVSAEKFIFSSSCSMYGIADGDVALDESADFAPVTAYAISKVKTEIGKTVDALDSFMEARFYTSYVPMQQHRIESTQVSDRFYLIDITTVKTGVLNLS